MTLRVDKVRKSFGGNEVLRDVSFSVDGGRYFGLAGASGCGKTTLLRILAGLERADSGEVRVGDTLLCGGDCCVEPRKRGMGFVFQGLALWPHMTATENVAFMFPGGVARAERRSRARALLARVRLPADSHDSYPDELSGGQCQRIAIARALAPEPRVLLLDEPFAHLDADLRKQLFATMQEIRDENVTIVHASHALTELESFADRIGVLEDGTVKERS